MQDQLSRANGVQQSIDCVDRQIDGYFEAHSSVSSEEVRGVATAHNTSLAYLGHNEPEEVLERTDNHTTTERKGCS